MVCSLSRYLSLYHPHLSPIFRWHAASAHEFQPCSPFLRLQQWHAAVIVLENNILVFSCEFDWLSLCSNQKFRWLSLIMQILGRGRSGVEELMVASTSSFFTSTSHKLRYTSTSYELIQQKSSSVHGNVVLEDCMIGLPSEACVVPERYPPLRI